MINPSKMTSSNSNSDFFETLVRTFLLVGLFVVIIGGMYYSAVVQQNVYKRQGVEMSVFEVFMGAQPVVRYVVEDKKGN